MPHSLGMLAADILLTASVLVMAHAWRQHLRERQCWGGAQKTSFTIVTVFAVISLALRFLPLMSPDL